MSPTSLTLLTQAGRLIAAGCVDIAIGTWGEGMLYHEAVWSNGSELGVRRPGFHSCCVTSGKSLWPRSSEVFRGLTLIGFSRSWEPQYLTIWAFILSASGFSPTMDLAYLLRPQSCIVYSTYHDGALISFWTFLKQWNNNKSFIVIGE